MHFVYVLESDKDKKLYIGFTNNLHSRLKKHTEGKVRSTMPRRPLTLLGFEQFSTKEEAIQRERQLKSWKSSKAVRKLFK